MALALEDLREGMVVVIRACDDWPEHHFLIQDIFADCVGGHSLDGPFYGEYGEPEADLIKSIVEEPPQGS